jgi:hypothetical protein
MGEQRMAGWPIEDMVDLARTCPHGLGKFYINTWPVFAAILEELREERPIGARSRSAIAKISRKNLKRRGANKCELTRACYRAYSLPCNC